MDANGKSSCSMGKRIDKIKWARSPGLNLVYEGVRRQRGRGGFFSATVTCQDLPKGTLLLWRLAALSSSIMRHANVSRPCAYLTDSWWCRSGHHGRSSTVRLLGVGVFCCCFSARVLEATCCIWMLWARVVAATMHRCYGDINLCCS
jgi:hypothetical protein